MIRFFGIAVLALSLIACDQAANKKGDLLEPGLVANGQSASGDKGEAPVISFEEEVFDYGTITQGEKVVHKFKFSNTGKSALILTAVKSTCGCTVADYPKEPIAPGSNGEISVVFKSSSKNKGATTKPVFVTSNAIPATTTLSLKGNVIAPD